jgi:hypothetical protein
MKSIWGFQRNNYRTHGSAKTEEQFPEGQSFAMILPRPAVMTHFLTAIEMESIVLDDDHFNLDHCYQSDVSLAYTEN